MAPKPEMEPDLEPEMEPEMTGDINAPPIAFAGHALVADRSGALYWPAERTLLVADMHLEKGSAFAERGRMLPPYDTRETLQRLGQVIARFQPSRVVALGDSLHDRRAGSRIDAIDLVLLASMQKGRQWVWIRGNHDPEIGRAFGGDVCDHLDVGGLRLQHEPSLETGGPEISGHLHPVARLAGRGATVRRPCFVADARRLVMPAFGAFTGGLNVRDEAFRPLFGGAESLRVWMLGAGGVYQVPVALLVDD